MNQWKQTDHKQIEFSHNDLVSFARESNAIEKIYRDPTKDEIDELERFINLENVTVEDLKHFVKIYQPDSMLRDKLDMNVRVGRYIPPFGGPEILLSLEKLLKLNLDAFSLHVEYEKLHPFMDCNGRSGRALWAWKNKNINGGFLYNFYHQTLGKLIC